MKFNKEKFWELCEGLQVEHNPVGDMFDPVIKIHDIYYKFEGCKRVYFEVYENTIYVSRSNVLDIVCDPTLRFNKATELASQLVLHLGFKEGSTISFWKIP